MGRTSFLVFDFFLLFESIAFFQSRVLQRLQSIFDVYFVYVIHKFAFAFLTTTLE